jgi:hypothetical protein
MASFLMLRPVLEGKAAAFQEGNFNTTFMAAAPVKGFGAGSTPTAFCRMHTTMAFKFQQDN